MTIEGERKLNGSRIARLFPDRGEHRLEFLDQTALELLRVTGRGQLMQCVWVYEHPVDFDGLDRFHRNFYASLGGRLIERSPLPFGRARWVRPVGPPPSIIVSDTPRPRDELMDWADELADLPIDPEHGPGWHLVVQPMSDGATAVSMLGSHVIGDGVGALLAIYEAISGNIRDAGYQPRSARSWPQAVAADFRQALRDAPLTARTVLKAAAMLVRHRHDFVRAGTADVDSADDDRRVVVPSVAIYVDTAEWDAKAEALGGNSYSLLAGFAAKLAEHLDRRRADGTVTLMIAINLRESLDDDRALAMAFANAVVDPATVTADLTETRDVVRAARAKAKREPDPAIELMTLVPWLPRTAVKGAVKGIAEMVFSYAEELPVSCSNLGDLAPDLARVDGTDAEYVFIRSVDTDVTLGELRRSHGQLVVVSGRINGKISISVEAYQLGAENSKVRLRGLAHQTLADFGLTGQVD